MTSCLVTREADALVVAALEALMLHAYGPDKSAVAVHRHGGEVHVCVAEDVAAALMEFYCDDDWVVLLSEPLRLEMIDLLGDDWQHEVDLAVDLIVSDAGMQAVELLEAGACVTCPDVSPAEVASERMPWADLARWA